MIPSLLKRLDCDAVLTVVSRFIIMFAGIATGVVTARLLGPEQRGIYFYAVTMAGFVTQIGNLGFPSANTFIVAQEPEAMPSLLVNSAWLSAVCLFLGAGLLYGIALQVERPPVLLVLAAALGAVNLMFMLVSNLLVGLQRIGVFNILQIVSNLLSLTMILLAGWRFGEVVWFMSAGLSATVVTTLISVFALARKHTLRWQFDLDLFRRSIGYSLRAFFVTLLGFAVLRGNVLFIENLAPAAELGYYSVAAQVADAVSVLPISFALVIFPRLVRQDLGRYEAAMKNARLMAVIMAAACIGAAILIQPFVTIAFGEAYAPAIQVFMAMLPGIFFLGVSTMISQYLAAVGFPLKTIAVWVLPVLCVVIFSALLVPRVGAVGAAIALSAGYVVLFAAMLYAARTEAGREPRS